MVEATMLGFAALNEMKKEETKVYLDLPFKPASESTIRESQMIISKALGIER